MGEKVISGNELRLVGLIAQLVEHCTGIAEVMGLNPVQGWIFFQALLSSVNNNCDVRSSNMSLTHYLSYMWMMRALDDKFLVSYFHP